MSRILDFVQKNFDYFLGKKWKLNHRNCKLVKSVFLILWANISINFCQNDLIKSQLWQWMAVFQNYIFLEHISRHLMFFVAHMLHLDSEKFLIEKQTFR